MFTSESVKEKIGELRNTGKEIKIPDTKALCSTKR